MDTRAQPSLACASCGSIDVQQARVRSAFWHDDRLVVVDDIPALVCEQCGEQSYDDTAAIVLDLLRGEGFPADQARGELRVPVFSYRDKVEAKGNT
jgi:YgiT-type zinc finger domain-containing protein